MFWRPLLVCEIFHCYFRGLTHFDIIEMKQGLKLSLYVLSICLVLQACSAQSGAGTITLDCATFIQGSGYQCGKCKTAKIVSNSDGSGTLSCSECTSGYPSGSKSVNKGDQAPASFNFGDYCSFLPSWGLYVLIALVLVVVCLTVFLLRAKLPCFKKGGNGNEENLNAGSGTQN